MLNIQFSESVIKYEVFFSFGEVKLSFYMAGEYYSVNTEANKLAEKLGAKFMYKEEVKDT